MKIYLVLLCLWFSSAVIAQDQDQTLQFKTETVDGHTCIASVLTPDNDNCKLPGGGRGSCEGIPDCVCSKPDKHIEWSGGEIEQYSVYFYQASPFDGNCNLNSNSHGKLKCKIKADADGDYEYGIKVPGCADFDPRIIIK